ncbi:MAG: toll/interleukin-1 receptor domain-containing protein [Anaerolineae bacterium]|nr:toll/interleukin-1 receptor domain-containing protein [Anaerolineae bacterium]
MYNPFREPIPRDPIDQIHAFAKDLAYGAINKRWGAELLITEDGREERWINPQNGNTLHELNYKWTKDSSNHMISCGILISFGYLERVSQEIRYARHKVTHRLTERAFELLNQPASSSIFISYRRSESSAFALLLLSRLKAMRLNPFLDMNIKAGTDWHARIKDEVVNREYFICILGPTSLESRYVVQELVWAIEANVEIIPIWHNGFNDQTLERFQRATEGRMSAFFAKQAIRVEEESALAYDGAIIQLFNHFGIMPF